MNAVEMNQIFAINLIIFVDSKVESNAYYLNKIQIENPKKLRLRYLQSSLLAQLRLCLHMLLLKLFLKPNTLHTKVE